MKNWRCSCPTFEPGFVNRLLPKHFSRLQMETKDVLWMNRSRGLRAITAEIEPLLGFFRFSLIDHSRKKDAIPRDDRRRPPSPRNVRFPFDVLRSRPLLRQPASNRNPPRQDHETEANPNERWTRCSSLLRVVRIQSQALIGIHSQLVATFVFRVAAVSFDMMKRNFVNRLKIGRAHV